MKKRKVNKLALALVLMALLGATTLVFSANESSPWGSKKRIVLYEEVPRPDMRRKDEPIDVGMEEVAKEVALVMPELEEAVVLAFGNVETQQLEFKMEEDEYNIKLSEEDVKRIEKLDKKNSKKNISNYKKMLGEFDVSSKQQIELSKYFDKECNPSDIYFAYDYLYRNYGTFEELETMLETREQGEDWIQIFEEYESENGVYEPMTFPKGYLEQLMRNGNVSADDIMIADRLAQKINAKSGQKALENELSDKEYDFIELAQESVLENFERLLGLRQEGVSWNSIKTELGLLDNKSKIKRIDISSSEVHALSLKYAELTEDEVMDALITAKTLDEDLEEIILSKRATKSDNVIFFEYLQKKYK